MWLRIPSQGLGESLRVGVLASEEKPYCFLRLVPSRKPREDATRSWRLRLPAGVG